MATNFLAARNSNLSSFNAVSINYSTIRGSTIASVSTMNVSTIVNSNITAVGINYSTLVGSSIMTNTLSANALVTQSLAYSTLTGSSITGSALTVGNVQGTSVSATTVTTSTITTTGNVGIGTANPAYRFDMPSGDMAIGSRLLGLTTPGNLFWLGLRGTATESQRLAIGINGDPTTGILSGVQIGITGGGLFINSSNNVGIGVTNPGYPLYVFGGAIRNNSGTTYYMNGSSTLQLWNSGNYANVGIYADQAIWTGTIFVANSDIRTKKNIVYLNDCLYKLDQINIVSYDKIDFMESGVDAGIIAQELQPILPKAVQTAKQIIPNIYACAIHKKQNGYIQITVSLPQNIKENTLCRLKIVKGDKEETYESFICNITDTLFNIAEWKEYSEDDKVFVYGTEVDDFLSVDKDQIGILAAGGVKELHQIIKEQQSQINQLIQRLAAANIA